MKKRISLLLFISLIGVPVSFAADSGTGCGLGSIIWEGQKGILSQLFAGTTNGTSGSQTFGITSGTSNCTNDGIVKTEEQVNVFVAVNLENLREEMAQGKGEYLTSLAELMNIPKEQQASFFAMTQEQFDFLYPKESTTPQELIQNLEQALLKHNTLAEVAVL